MIDRELVGRLSGQIVGRAREVELVLAALAADRHVLLEGPPGTGKSTLLRAVARELALGFQFVEGNAELTPARLVGHFDPARVLSDGYSPDVFVDGPLISAMREGALLYLEEINRIPEETLNVLITVMSERELNVPRLGLVMAAPGFRLVAAMNPFDAVGTARISGAVYDRVCRLAVGYQSATDEANIVLLGAPRVDPQWNEKLVDLVRRTRNHPDLRVGSSVRGAIDAAAVATSLASLRGLPSTDFGVGMDAAILALSGRVRVREGCSRSSEEIITELWHAVFGPPAEEVDGGGKSPRPDGGHDLPLTREGDEADEAVAQSSRKTTSRRDLSRNPRFEQISPEVGELDEAMVDESMEQDPDDTMALLADLTAATDPKLRELARRLAGRLMLEVSQRGPARPRGIGKLVEQPYRPDGGDLDLDASMDAIAEARGAHRAVDPRGLRIRGWVKPGTALCLMVDRSGSMGGKPLATSAVAAAAVAWRAPADYSVLAFGKDVVVAKSQDVTKAPERVVNDVLSLRGFGTTDLCAVLRAAQTQLTRSNAGRRVAVLLSDCRATVEGDVVQAAAGLDELVIIAPEGDSAEAEKLAQQLGLRLTTVSGPSEVAAALARVLEL